MLDQDLQLYRRSRTEGFTAKEALQVVRTAIQVRNVPWRFGKPFEYEGFTIRVTVGPDPVPVDLSWLGEFTDNITGHHSEGIYLKNPLARGRHQPRNVYQWFRLAVPVRERVQSILEHRRCGRRQAWEMAWRSAQEDVLLASVHMSRIITVTARKDGITLGLDVLSGVDGDDDQYHIELVLANGMIENAVQEARQTLQRLCSGSKST